MMKIKESVWRIMLVAVAFACSSYILLRASLQLAQPELMNSNYSLNFATLLHGVTLFLLARSNPDWAKIVFMIEILIILVAQFFFKVELYKEEMANSIVFIGLGGMLAILGAEKKVDKQVNQM